MSRQASSLKLAFVLPIVLAVLGVFGWIFVRIIAPPLLKVLEARQWVEVEAQVTGSRAMPVRPGSNYLKAEISYTYEWQDETYTGNRYQFFSWDGDKERVRPRNIAARYPAGRHIRVFIDPQQPDQSVIQRGLTMSARGDLFFLTILLLFVIGGLRELVRRLVPAEAPAQTPAARHDAVTFRPDVDDADDNVWAPRPREEAKESKPTTALSIALAVVFLLLWFGFSASLVFTQWQERPHLLFLPLIWGLAPVWIGLYLWYSRRRSIMTRLILRAEFPDGLHFGQRNRVRYTVETRDVEVIKIVFSLEGHRWPPGIKNSGQNLRRYFHRTPPLVVEDAAHLRQGELWLNLPADPHPAGIHATNDIGWYLKALVYTGPSKRMIRMLELATYPARSRELAPWERQRAERVVVE